MHVLVIGAGAIGSLLGAKLALAGNRITLVDRPVVTEAVRAGGLILHTPKGEQYKVSAHTAESIAAALAGAAALAETPSFDLALLSVKTFDTAGAISEMLDARDSQKLPPVLTLQNGVGNEEALRNALGADRIVSGAINTPVSVPRPGTVEVNRDTYKIGLAPVGDPALADSTARLLTEAGFAVTRYPDYRGLKWTKLLMNILANASSAILDWSPAEIMAHPVTARLEALAWQEALTVMAAQKIKSVALAGYPIPLVAPLARVAPAPWLGRALRGFVSGGRGSKMPSLHIALAGGRPSEVGWLNGAVARQGLVAGIPTPVNTRFNDLVNKLTEGEIDPALYHDNPQRLAAECR